MLVTQPGLAVALAESVVGLAGATSEVSEAALLTLPEKEWAAVRSRYQLEQARRTGKVSTGSIFDQLEAETGGNVTAEALGEFIARMQASRG